MATTGLDFGAQISEWVARTTQRTEAVFKESTQRTVARMQTPVGAGGNMPVDTGYLRASIRASTESMPRIDPGAKAPIIGGVPYNADDVTATIINARLGQTIFVGYVASYAPYVEYGTSKMPPRAFVGLAVQQWPATVTQVCEELRNRVEARAR
jgi:HK97 gp10 family phage protein